MFIPLAIALLIGTYTVCFRDEFDQENLKTVMMAVAVVCVVLVLIAVLASLGGSGSTSSRTIR
ncbi:hypothetical protein FACS1894208_00800 [Clostridia bacterium]|nr:hypothetical protein FACS1894208_00800 [Clostridia bacterium]